MTRCAAFVTVFILILSILSCKKAPETSALPLAELVDLDGRKVTMAQFSGKPVIVNFWATWCGPCRLEIPMINELYKKYSPHGLVIVGVSTDDDGAPAVKEFNKEVPIQYLSYLTTPDVEAKFGQVWALPTTYFYDRNGKLLEQPLVGIQSRDYWEKRIQQLLKE